eukprot:scaffold3782_cov75-Phaeocystis_antarctica.AAC.1
MRRRTRHAISSSSMQPSRYLTSASTGVTPLSTPRGSIRKKMSRGLTARTLEGETVPAAWMRTSGCLPGARPSTEKSMDVAWRALVAKSEAKVNQPKAAFNWVCIPIINRSNRHSIREV